MYSIGLNPSNGPTVFITTVIPFISLWMVATCCLCLTPIMHIAWAQDLAVDWVTVNPSEGAAGDAVTLQARIVNNGPGTVYTIQYQWFLSAWILAARSRNPVPLCQPTDP